MTNTSELRHCFIEGLPDQAQAENFVPLPEQIYVPQGHRRALSLDWPLVLGGRGAGKTFWLKSLIDKDRRRIVADAFKLPALAKTTVSVGFDPSDVESPTMPHPRTLRNLLDKRLEPYDIWSAVVLRAMLKPSDIPSASWDESVRWVASNGETVSRLLRDLEGANVRKQCFHLVVFDGLDRTAPHSWEETQSLLRGLLMAALDFRAYRTLRVKMFLRPDMLERSATAFPDASKLTTTAVELAWPDTDLYGLLWQYLANQRPSGTIFRKFVGDVTQLKWHQIDNTFPVPEQLQSDSALQQRLFHALAGKSMGGGPNRGDTWKWLPNHLADASGYVSPRSFIVALHDAAKDSGRRDVSGKETNALSWRSIQEGVRKASKTRVDELYEDFPWVRFSLEPLAGLNVPCLDKEIFGRWKQAGTLDRVFERTTDRLPPANVSVKDDPQGLLTALVALGVFRTMKGGRINMPDIIRVEANIGRKGGVPVRKKAFSEN